MLELHRRRRPLAWPAISRRCSVQRRRRPNGTSHHSSPQKKPLATHGRRTAEFRPPQFPPVDGEKIVTQEQLTMLLQDDTIPRRVRYEPYGPWSHFPSGALHVDSTVPEEEEISEDEVATNPAHRDAVVDVWGSNDDEEVDPSTLQRVTRSVASSRNQTLWGIWNAPPKANAPGAASGIGSKRAKR